MAEEQKQQTEKPDNEEIKQDVQPAEAKQDGEKQDKPESNPVRQLREELKKSQKRIAEMEAKRKEEEEKKLAEKEEWKTLAEKREQELTLLREQAKADSLKATALSKINGLNISPDMQSFAIEQAQKLIESDENADVAKHLQTTYPSIFTVEQKSKVSAPSTPVVGGEDVSFITHTEWAKLKDSKTKAKLLREGKVQF